MKETKHTTGVHTFCRQCGAPVYIRTEYIGGKVREIVNRLCDCESDRRDRRERAKRQHITVDEV